MRSQLKNKSKKNKFIIIQCAEVFVRIVSFGNQKINFKFVSRGEVMNGGFGLVLDGSESASAKAKSMLNWDVSNGVARRYIFLPIPVFHV